MHLLADGTEIAKQAFFQPTDPGICPNCSKNAAVSLDFRVTPDQVLDKRLSVEIHVPGQRQIGTGFPISKAGNPTINVRYLIGPDFAHGRKTCLADDSKGYPGGGPHGAKEMRRFRHRPGFGMLNPDRMGG